MFDSLMRPIIDPSLNKVADHLTKYSLPATIITLAGFAVGLIGCFALAIGAYLPGLLLVFGNILITAVGRTFARRDGETDVGTFLNLVCDAIFYAAFIFFFVLGHPEHILAGAFLLFSYIAAGTSLLAYRYVAAQRGISPYMAEGKSLFHPATLVENTETIVFMVLVCLMPGYFSAFAFILGLMCWVTTVGRGFEAWRAFSPIEQNYDQAENIR